MKFNFNVKINKKIKYKYNGKEYNSFEEMPEDVRKIFEGLKQEGKLPEIPQNKNAEEDYDESADSGKNLVKNRTKEQDAGEIYNNIITSSDTTVNNWYYGVVFIGLVFVFLGLMIMNHIIKIRQYGFNLLSITSFIFVLSGFGLILRQKWARILMLILIPFNILLVLYLFGRPLPEGFQKFLYALIVFFVSAFVYLVLPRVNKEFSLAKKKRFGQELKMPNLAAPPRKVPFSLKLSVNFGNPTAIFCVWMVSGIVILPVLMKFKKVLGGFHLEPGMPLIIMLPTILTPAVSVVFVAVMMIIVAKFGKRQIYLFGNGLQTYGTMIKKVKIDLPDSILYRVTFEYEVNGQKYKIWEDIPNINRLEDNEKSPILYNPENPKNAMLLDSLPAHITVDDMGNLKHKYPFMGYIYASIPIALLVGIYLIIK